VEKPTSNDLTWIDRELAGSAFRDERLGKRLRKIVAQLDKAVGEPIPLACADWANTKCAFRRSRPGISSEGGRLYRSKPAGDSDDPGHLPRRTPCVAC
jgi:hypothetical protein